MDNYELQLYGRSAAKIITKSVHVFATRDIMYIYIAIPAAFYNTLIIISHINFCVLLDTHILNQD